MGNMPLAKDAFPRATQSTSCHSDPYLMLANCHLSEKDAKSAIFILRKACEVLPDDTTLNTKLGVLLLMNGIISQGDEKLLSLQHVSTTTTSNLPLSLAVGSVLQSRNDIDGALYR